MNKVDRHFHVRFISREGVIIEWPLNGHFHDAGDVILTSRIDVREMVDHDHDHDILSEYQKCQHF